MKAPKRVRWEVAPFGGIGWKVTRESVGVHFTFRKASAIAIAVGLCWQAWIDRRERSELLIKDRDGKIQDARTYGEDPRKSKG